MFVFSVCCLVSRQCHTISPIARSSDPSVLSSLFLHRSFCTAPKGLWAGQPYSASGSLATTFCHCRNGLGGADQPLPSRPPARPRPVQRLVSSVRLGPDCPGCEDGHDHPISRMRLSAPPVRDSWCALCLRFWSTSALCRPEENRSTGYPEVTHPANPAYRSPPTP